MLAMGDQALVQLAGEHRYEDLAAPGLEQHVLLLIRPVFWCVKRRRCRSSTAINNPTLKRYTCTGKDWAACQPSPPAIANTAQIPADRKRVETLELGPWMPRLPGISQKEAVLAFKKLDESIVQEFGHLILGNGHEGPFRERRTQENGVPSSNRIR